MHPGRWMRVAGLSLTLALVGACASESGLSPLPTDQVRASFPPGGVVNSIEIDAVDRLPLRTAELVSPDGQATPASYLHVSSSPSVTFYQRRIDTPYEGNLFTTDNVAAVPGAVPGVVAGAPQGDAQLLAMVSSASIPVPDEIEYRRDWRSYSIFLSFGDLAGEVERRVLSAPEPPPKR